MAAPLAVDWTGTDVSIGEVESELARLRRISVGADGHPNQRTSVMTHIAWVPPDWIDAELSVRCFPVGERSVCGEVIELVLRGGRSCAPASIVLPLAISDLPVFVRWRGEPPFGAIQWEQLVGVADRVIVDSSEWGELRYRDLADAFGRTAVSDIAWARLEEWRFALAGYWPGIAHAEIAVRGPRAEATLLRGWLAGRLGRRLPPVVPAGEIGVRLDGEEVAPPAEEPRSPSDLLSAELDLLVRDPVYEAAVIAAGAAAAGLSI